ncbi:outer membrane beta-barrel protein [Hymenobacter glacialis]|uniref:Outer membrane protein beta-barrel domain-containing protein n=1 Tax=Hymenobacter glacialis TaxID=1908236 RepID=A0A1G1T2I3_9BACT|nr:outer membrane beta-barrel protein [Hymenobacter glacialis]OGX85067.1 hypothetical protein BEN48_15175 [Hymenobacter glacialis]
MTDRKPDDLYDALRNRLADYGQEPPAQLWAGIKAQLPLPVARPQLRRRRRWSPVLLLGLLLAVVGGAAWQWWRTAGPGQSAAGTGQMATTGPRSENRTAATASVPPQAATDVAGAVAAGPNSPAARTSTGTATAAQATELAAAKNPLPAFQKNIDVTTLNRSAAATRGRRLAAVRSGNFSAGRADAAYAEPITAADSDAAASVPAMGAAASNTEKVAVRQETAPEASKTARPRVAPAEALATGDASPALPAVPLAGLSAPVAGVNQSQSLADSPQAGTNEDAPDAAGSAQNTAAAGAMLRRTPALALAGFPLPTAQLSADTAPAMPVVVAQRWALQLLGGPAQTFRTLGGGASLEPLPNRNLPPTAAGPASDNVIANALAEKEKSSTGFGLQVQARRVLSGRWGVSAGLGYQEYATRTDYSGPVSYTTYSVSGLPTRASREVSLRQRDTYRFATVPVRVSYALGQASKHLRYGLRAGTDVAVYLGGSTTRSAPSALKNNSPYRPLSLSVMAGLDLHYRVGPRLELLAQPHATYFLTSLPKPISGLTPRYLWGAGALVGVSYELR